MKFDRLGEIPARSGDLVFKASPVGMCVWFVVFLGLAIAVLLLGIGGGKQYGLNLPPVLCYISGGVSRIVFMDRFRVGSRQPETDELASALQQPPASSSITDPSSTGVFQRRTFRRLDSIIPRLPGPGPSRNGAHLWALEESSRVKFLPIWIFAWPTPTLPPWKRICRRNKRPNLQADLRRLTVTILLKCCPAGLSNCGGTASAPRLARPSNSQPACQNCRRGLHSG